MGDRLAGKCAVISGAASGIGRATAIRFADEGARVALMDIDEPGANGVADEIDRRGGKAIVAVSDVSKETDVEEAFRIANRTLGAVNVIVSNAGIQSFGEDSLIHDLDAAVWDRTMSVNLRGAFLVCKHGIRSMLSTGGGTVICTASPTGLYGVDPTFTAYSSSKAGVFGLVRVMAAGYGSKGIRVNAVFPGFTDTPLVRRTITDPEQMKLALRGIPLGRPGKPEEIAALMVFVASDEASYSTGAAFFADGGITAI